ncbi:hypothetical protein Mycsm_00115 [Mycobacterium sp. JS623]|uniref:DUF305 domain-containing protein n=1 Tax=Mycobacterium sp. JS623 TaxID=212767 RepID=UPI0002A582AE|nr:DUF305 domain-containing protein [Mycobacterium sp. JS623]AGB20576.1 hypothetical protein Mycsm_00115 [Mycobacterium sp. JS623]
MTRLLAALVAVATALFLSSCSSPKSDGHTDHPKSDEPVITGQPAGYNADDVAFATNMIPHHQQAVDLSALVPDRTTNAALQQLATQISAAQQPEIQVMKVFLVQWNENPENNAGHAGHGNTMLGMVDEATMTKLKSLNGAEFDKLWLQSMIGHHQGAIEMAKAEIANGDNVDAKSVAKNIVTAQEAEIGQMKQMLGG